MEPKQIFSIVVMVMLSFEGVHSKPGNWSIRSFHRGESDKPNCDGSLIRIQCSNPTDKYCEAKCNGTYTTDPGTHFEIKGFGGNKVCIRFNGTYALKVVHDENKTLRVQFERQQCSNATSEFLFEETKDNSSRVSYKHTAENDNKTTFLSCSCDNEYVGVSLQKNPDPRSKFLLNREDI